MNYNPKNSNVEAVALRVQTLKLPFTIAGSATSANVVVTPYDPSVLFYATDGTTTIANGLDSGEASPTFASTGDSSGKISLMAAIGETINKIVGAKVLQLGGSDQAPGSVALANTTGLTANKNKIVLDVNTGVAFNTSTTLTLCLEVSYVAAQ